MKAYIKLYEYESGGKGSELLRFEHCCDTLKKNFGENSIIHIGNDYHAHNKIGILCHPDDYYSERYPIDFCPWCGKKIEIEVISKVKRIIKQQEIIIKSIKNTFEDIEL